MTYTSSRVVELAFDPAERSQQELESVLFQIRRGAGDLAPRVHMGVHRDRLSSESDMLSWLANQDDVNVVIYWEGSDSSQSALNTAVASASSEFVIVLEDAFAIRPGELQHLSETVRDLPHDWLPIPVVERQGRLGDDTPPVTVVTSQYNAWEREGVALVCRRSSFLQVRGYDEHPTKDTCWSIDLRERLNGAGFSGADSGTFAPVAYFSENRGRRGSRSVARPSAERDRSIYRNLVNWSVPTHLRQPLVSVAIATHNRARYLAQSISSVLSQTFQDFEIVVVDDGSEDDTADVVRTIGDPRIKYFRQEHRGISSARNLAADVSTGTLTAVHDDDDIMLPSRLEDSLRAMTADTDATYGSWVNFHDETGHLQLHVIRDGFDANLVAFNGQGPGHSTWLVPTSLIRATRYDETYSSSVDHDLATRLAWQGCRWLHTGRVAYLRRVHASQVTATDNANQKFGHVLTRFLNTFGATELGRTEMRRLGSEHKNPEVPGRSDLFRSFGGYLPDSLVSRSVTFSSNVNTRVMLLGDYSRVDAVMTERDHVSGRLRAERAYVNQLTWDDMVKLRRHGEYGYQPIPRLKGETEGVLTNSSCKLSLAQRIVSERLSEIVGATGAKTPQAWFAALSGLADDDLILFRGADTLVRLVSATDDGTVVVDLIGYQDVSSDIDVRSAIERLISNGKLAVIPLKHLSNKSAAEAAMTFARGTD